VAAAKFPRVNICARGAPRHPRQTIDPWTLCATAGIFLLNGAAKPKISCHPPRKVRVQSSGEISVRWGAMGHRNPSRNESLPAANPLSSALAPSKPGAPPQVGLEKARGWSVFHSFFFANFSFAGPGPDKKPLHPTPSLLSSVTHLIRLLALLHISLRLHITCSTLVAADHLGVG